MRTHLKLPALAIVAVLSSRPVVRARRPRRRAPAHPRRPPRSRPPRPRLPRPPRRRAPRPSAPTPEPAKACAQSKDAGAMQMWERSGGNKGMVDILVCAWNAANPTKPINLSYIVHTEMVAKIAQGIASGDVPDLMGMDLIYAPQFENAGQLVDITDQTKDWAEIRPMSARATRPSRRSRTACTAFRCTPTCRRCSTTRTCSRRPGSTRRSRRPAWPRSARTPTRSPRSAATPRATTCPATAPAATSSPSAR